MCWQKIRNYFKKKPEQEPVDLAELRWKSPRWFKRILRIGKVTHHGGPNMPRFQPCPRCYGKAKRTDKPVGGANYQCRRHGPDEPSFFVRAP